MTSLVLLLALLSPARASTVSLDGWRYFELRPPAVEEDTSAPPAPWASSREVVFTPEANGLRVRATWTVDAPVEGWLDGVLAGPGVRVESVRLDGAPAPIVAQASGTRITASVSGRSTVVLEGFVDGDPAAGLALALFPAVRGTVALGGDPRELVITDGARAALRAPEGLLASGRDLTVRLADPAAAAEKRALYVAEVASGLTVRDGDVEGHARVRWLVRQGELPGTVALAVRGAGRDVRVSGDNVRSSTWSGDTLLVTTERPVRDVLEVELAWSSPVPAGEAATLAVPEITPSGAFRVDGSLLVARDDVIEVVPELGAYEPVPIAELPSTGLISGTPTSAWRGTGAGSLAVLRVVPVEQPAALVDVASHTIAANDEGRVLMRSYLTVRNERAPALRIVAPEGLAILGVQVSGEPVTLGRDKGPGVLVPLPRSLETVEGLLSFPIEVIAFGTTAAWEKREERRVPLLKVEAPIGVQRVTLHLPPGYAARNEAGEDDVVDAFTEGESITYGLAVGDVAAAEADARFQEALDAWMVNDFEVAQQKLDDLRELGVETENVKKLQSNLDVVDKDEEIGVAEAEEDTAMARRVKDMARARASEDVTKREALIQEAKEAERAGDYDRAASSYSTAYEIGEKLAGLEQTESASFRGSNASVRDEIEVVAKKAKEKVVVDGKPDRSGAFAAAKPAATPMEPPRPGTATSRTTYDFEDLSIEGELVKPEGSYAIPVEAPPPDVAARVPLVDLGNRGDDDLGFLQEGARGVAVDVPADPGVIDLLAADPSYVTGLPDGDAYGLGIIGTGMGGGGSGEAVGYGYGYGVVGGAMGGVAEGRAYTVEAIQALPASRGGRGPRGGGGLGTLGTKGRGSGRGYGSGGGGFVELGLDDASPIPTLALGGEEPEEPVVTAQSLSLVVPDLGETVLFQSVLLPDDAAPAVLVKARKTQHATNPAE